MTYRTTQPRFTANRAALGFTLMEVLVAMAIFLIGFVAVFSVFPVAALLQKNTIEEISSKHAARNAEQLFVGRGYASSDIASWSGSTGNDKKVFAPTASMLSHWDNEDRAFPSHRPLADRKFWWYPLFKKSDGANTDPNEWVAYVFVLKGKQSDLASPPVTSIAATATGTTFTFTNSDGKIKAGDFFLDENGVVYRAASADSSGCTVSNNIDGSPTKIWYGPPVTGEIETATQSILVVTGFVH